MKGLRYHITSLYLLVASLALVAQNTTPTFVVDYKSADPATVSQKGIGFAKSSNGSQYSLSDDGKYHSQQDVGKIRHINRYYEPPVTHVYTDDSSSEAVVKEYRSDGTVVLDAATVKDVPQVGEIIVSGVTDAAPYGFLKHVESVKKANGQIVITTSDASLNEVLYDTHIEQRLVFREADAEGSAVYLYPQNGPMYANNAELLHLKKKFDVFERPGGKVSFLGKDIDEYCKGSVNVDLTLGGTFIWDSDGWIPDRIGLSLDGSLSLSVVIEAGLKLEKDEDKLTWKVGPEIPLQPIVFPAGMVPVVIVPVVQFKLGIRSAEGKLYAKWKPIDLEAATFDAHAIWIREGNKDGDNWDFGADCSSDLTDMSVEGLFQDMLNAEAGLTGEAKFSVWPEVRFKLYDTDNVSMAVGVAPFAKLSGDLALKWQNSSSADVLDEFELKDNISLDVGIDVPLEGKVKFNVFGKIIGGAKNASLTLLEKDLIQTGSFIPVFNDFRITPDEDVKKWNSAHVSAYEGLSIFSKYESDFGFCMAQVKKDASGKELPREWDYHSLKSKYSGSSYGADMQLKIEWDIPTDDLLYNATYEVRPYTVLSIMSTPYWFWRKGGTFTTGEGGDNPDIPSLKLSANTLTLTAGSKGTVDVVSGSGNYTVKSSNSNVATATREGSKVTVTAVAEGSAVITVKDQQTNQTADIQVTVNKSNVPSLQLSTTTLALTPGQQATVEITSGSGSYEAVSSAKTVATVTVSGSKLTVKGVGAGTATITVKDNKTQQRAKIEVTVSNTPQSYLTCPDDHHPHLIDLGLPSGTKWACCNVADNPAEQAPTSYGTYYALGETSGKDYYYWNTYIHCGGSDDTCHNLGSDIAGTQYDVAHVRWGGSWVMPSEEQQDELRNNCTSEWTTVNGVGGRLFKAPNGGSIFLPAAGFRWYDDLYYAGSCGYYWSSTQSPWYSYGAYSLDFGSVSVNWSTSPRGNGRSVRPVSR